jgi:Zn-dependent peptidase ImmA (M78 family)
MKRKFLRTIQVANTNYKLFSHQDLTLEGFDGYCDCQKKEIVLDKQFSSPLVNRTLIHELIHAIHEEIGVHQILNEQSREMVAESLSNFLCSTFEMRFKKK